MNDKDYEKEKQRLYQVGSLWVGWRFFSPAGRWETVVSVDDGGNQHSYMISVKTDKTAADYAWPLRSHNEVRAIPPGMLDDEDPLRQIWLMDFPGSGGSPARILVGIAEHGRWSAGNGIIDNTLVHAQHLGRGGEGWEVIDRPNGDTTDAGRRRQVFPTKARAKSAAVAAAKQHAKKLGLSYAGEIPRPY